MDYAQPTPADAPILRRANLDTSKGPVSIKWFEGATLNLSYNALDRHVEAGRGDRVAFYWSVCRPKCAGNCMAGGIVIRSDLISIPVVQYSDLSHVPCREGNDVEQESTMTYKQLLDLTCQVRGDMSF